MTTETMPPSYSEKMQRVRDAAANLLQVAIDEGFFVVGVAFNKSGELIEMRNTNENFVQLLKAVTAMVERTNSRPIIHDTVTRQN